MPTPATPAAASALRQMDKCTATMQAIRDDVHDDEFDGARAHIEILRGQLAELSEKLFQTATTEA